MSQSHFRNDDLQRAGFIRVDIGEAQAEQQRAALAAANKRAAAELEAEEQAEHEQGAKAAEEGPDVDLEAEGDDEEAGEVDLMQRRLAELKQQLTALEQAIGEFGSKGPAPLRIAPDGDAACRPVRRAPRSRYS